MRLLKLLQRQLDLGRIRQQAARLRKWAFRYRDQRMISPCKQFAIAGDRVGRESSGLTCPRMMAGPLPYGGILLCVVG